MVVVAAKLLEFISTKSPNIHKGVPSYITPLFAKWTKENQQEFAYLAKEPIVENPMEILKNSMNETTKPYYGFEIKPFHFFLINSSAKEFLNQFPLFYLFFYKCEMNHIFSFRS